MLEEKLTDEKLNSEENQMGIQHVKKRDGTIVPFDLDKIEIAIRKSFVSSGEGNLESDPREIALSVEQDIIKTAQMLKKRGISEEYIPSIEEIQRPVETNILRAGFPTTAHNYISYRENRDKVRSARDKIPSKTRELFEDNKKYFQNPLSEFVFFNKYSRFLPEEGRREVWTETVDRYTDFMRKKLDGRFDEDTIQRVRDGILNQKAMPSMRLLWSAGPAAERCNVAAYNCAFILPDNLKAFGEAMYTLMSGTGVGFSVENKVVSKLPMIQKQTGIKLDPLVIEDSKEGWADATVEALTNWFDGYDRDFDYSKIRPAGSRLVTMGGRSSGPEPMRRFLDAARSIVLGKQERRLSSLDVHDLMCYDASAVVAGGVRRSASISLSDPDDLEMRLAKSGSWWMNNSQRQLANNSAAYSHRPSAIEFMREWLSLAESGSGERGIFNRGGLKDQIPERRWDLLNSQFPGLVNYMGVNPCGEINLLPDQFCNLTSVTIRPEDTEKSLMEKVELASIMGTYQASLTDFNYISDSWKEHCESERLLGISLNGVMSNPIARDPEVLQRLREHAVETNKYYAKQLGINPATAITCVKPEGTNSLLVGTSPGFHPIWDSYMLRHVESDVTDPVLHMLQDQGYPIRYRDATKPYVLPFVFEAPKGTITRNQIGTLEQLEIWKTLKENWTEHNPSATIYVGKDDWFNAGQWVYDNFAKVGGLSFFPKVEGDHVYKFPPYQGVSRDEYLRTKAELPKIDFANLALYETEDSTSGARELACAGGKCDL